MFEARKPGAIRARLSTRSREEIARFAGTPDEPITKSIPQPAAGARLEDLIPEVRDWLSAWKEEAERVPGMTLLTTRKGSKGVKFSVPSRIRFETLAAYAEWLGVSREYHLSGRRIAALAEIDRRLLGMTGAWRPVSEMDENDFLSFCRLIEWRRDNPDETPPVRALVIDGLDTKWIETNLALVRAAFRLIECYRPGGDSEIERLGFDSSDRMTVWFRAGASVGGGGDLATQMAFRPTDTHAGLFPGALRVIVVENLTSFEMIDLGPRDLAIWGQGNQAPAALAAMSWLTEIGTALYWGDMDAEGYRILSRSRRAMPGIRSILMGEADASRSSDRAVAVPRHAGAVPDLLTDAEASAYNRVAPEGLRIEQEKLSAEEISAALHPAT